MIKSLKIFQNKFQNNINLYLNHLSVIYAFLLPINHYAKTSVFFVILILFLVRGNYKFYLSYPISMKVVQAFLLFFLLHLVWLVGTDNMHEGKHMLGIAKNAIFPLLFLSFLDMRFSRRIISAFVIGMLMSELISYSIHFGLIPWTFSVLDTVVYRAYNAFDPSPFLHHSHYAAALALTISLLVWNIINKKLVGISKIVALFFIITGSINLSIVGGRVGYVIYMILLLLLVFLRYKKKWLYPMLFTLVGLSLLFGLAYNFSSMVKGRTDQSINTVKLLSNDTENYRSSFGNRLGFWKYSTEVIKENFIFGVGTGDHMQKVHEKIRQEHSYLKKLVHPHNEYVLVFLEFGVIGLLVFLNIFYQIIKVKLSNDYLQYVLISTSITVSIALMSETFHEKFYFPLWVFITSVALTEKKWLKEDILRLDFNIMKKYILLIITFLIIGIVQ